MAHYEVVIETRREQEPSVFKGRSHIHVTVAQGPDFVRTYGGRWETDALNAYESLGRIVKEDWPEHTFDFLHAPHS